MSSEHDLVERAVRVLEPPEPSFERLVRRKGRKQRNHRIAAGVVGVAVALAVAVGGASLIRSSRPTPADPDRTISPLPIPPMMSNGPITVFGMFEGIRELTPDGSLTELVDCHGDCTVIQDVAWTPDGTRMAFVAQCGGGCASAGDPFHGIHVLDVRDGSDEVILPGDAFAALDWSPDGTRIAYSAWTSYEGGEWVPDGRLHILSVATGEIVTLPSLRDVDAISWSPDGTRFALSTGRRLSVASTDGSVSTTIGEGRAPDWSPDGTRIAFRLDCEIWTTAPDGEDRTLIATMQIPGRTHCYPNAYLGGRETTIAGPVWSPDGTSLVAIGRNRVFVIDVVSGNIEELTRLHPYWSGVAWRPVP